ncbi:MAG: DEAD/DEAH box helicase [Armatimonadota bacterium]
MSNAYARLNVPLQRRLRLMGWTHLKPIQVQAIHAVLGGDSDILITAQTAAGKTEAAFLPILSASWESLQGAVTVMYVGPLKALINDQFRRLEDLCKQEDIPVTRWHGDVDYNRKKRLMQHPSGVLLITPESLEGMFVNHPERLSPLFAALQFVVIDELHAFLGDERGIHLRSLLHRIQAVAKQRVRLVGLSATIGALMPAKEFMNPDFPETVTVVQDDTRKEVQMAVHGYLRKNLHHGDIRPTPDEDREETPEQSATQSELDIARQMIRFFEGRTGLVFFNSRGELEFYADLCNRVLAHLGRPPRFHTHHGSLAKAEREMTEEALRDQHRVVAFCTSTLELGIDVGNCSAVGQVRAPWTVSEMRQRLGRSGRHEGEASVMELYISQNEPSERSDLVDHLFPDLLQSVAMVELMRQGWCEPPQEGIWHGSTLLHQTLSLVAQYGGASAPVLVNTLLSRGAFRNIPQGQYLELLKAMAGHDLIEQTPEGLIILGLKGEQMVRHHDFYAAFASPKELKVISQGRLIGTITAVPDVGASRYLILAGRRWRILEVNLERDEIIVRPSPAGRVPLFTGTGGPNIHQLVRDQMMKVLMEGGELPYMDATAQRMLEDARHAALEANLGYRRLVEGGDCVTLFTWCSSVIHRSILGCALLKGMDVLDRDIALVFRKHDRGEVLSLLRWISEAPPSVEELAAAFPVMAIEKFDRLLPVGLLARCFGSKYLDPAGCVSLASQLLASELKL